METLTRYDAFLVSSAPVFGGDTKTPSGAGAGVGGLFKMITNNIGGWLPFKQAQSPQRKATAAKSEEGKNEGESEDHHAEAKPKSPYSKVVLPRPAALSDSGDKNSEDQCSFDPCLSFSVGDELQFPSLVKIVIAESGKEDGSQFADILESEWKQHTEQDCLKSSYLALYNCDEL